MAILSPLNDFVFKRLFGNSANNRSLVSLLKAALDLNPAEFAEVTILNPILEPDSRDAKTNILDVKLKTAGGIVIDVEMQVCVTHALKDRLIYYLARLFTGQLRRGEPYALLERAVSLIIVGGILSPEEKGYYNSYRIQNRETSYEFSDLVEINILELGKLPPAPDKQTELWNWGQFFVSKSEEELKMAGERDAVIGETVVKLMELSADERERELAEAREKWLWEQAAMRQTGYAEGEARGIQLGEAIGEVRLREAARKLKQLGLPLDQIAQATGLSAEELSAL